MSEPIIVAGDLAVDDRGSVSFVNGFGFEGVKRFYVVSNHERRFVRAWHAHKEEAKYCFVVQGSALFGAVAVDDWNAPSRELEVHRFVLSAGKPSVLFIPAGHANGFMSLAEDTKVMFFSTSSVEDSRRDDVRYDARYWDIWNVLER